MKGYIEKLIRDNLFSNLNLKNKDLTLEINNSVDQIRDSYYDSLNKDYNYLIDNYAKAINITDFIYSFTRDFSDNNINFKCDKFIEMIKKR